MKKSLILTPTGDMTREQWLGFRVRGIGASEVAAVMGLNQYKSTIELFYDKLGQVVYNFENMAMFCGKELETFIAKMWEYWEGSEESMIENFRAGRKVRRCQRVNAYIQNPEFPWLFVSLDRKINRGARQEEGSLEIKTIAQYEADKWEGGLPPAYVVQVQTQILVCGFTFGEMAVFNDNRSLDVLPFEFNRQICDGIIDTTKKFWDKVEKARRWLTVQYEAKRTFNFKMVQECEKEIQALEPPPDNTQAYADFLKKKYAIADPGERTGTEAQRVLGLQHRGLAPLIAALEREKLGYENALKNSMKDGCDKLTFGDKGFISWRNDVNNVRRFLNKLTE